VGETMKNIRMKTSAWLLGTAALLVVTACSGGDAKLLKDAEAAVGSGNYVVAADLFSQVSNKNAADKNKARIGIKNMLTATNMKGASTEDFADILESYNKMNFSKSGDSVQKVYDLAVDRINADETGNVATLELLYAAQDLGVETQQDLTEKTFDLLTIINKNDPTNLLAATELGEIHYNQGDLESAKAVLDPVKDNLGDSEGARVLGQVYVAEGNNKDAYPLLSAYTTSRLERFQNAEKRFVDLQDKLWEEEFERLNEGDGPASFYLAYNRAEDEEKQLVVDNFISAQIETNESYNAALEEYRDSAAIVPVVMDFGILQLRNAETMTSEAERNAELTAAEETFLSIRSVAGGSDDYKIYLGQVYFWLGKQDEGMGLFNEVLDGSGRDPVQLVNVSSTLRNLGKVGLAAELAQEAYDSSDDKEIKGYAANMMQLLANSIEDRITWLERGDQDSGYVKSSLLDNKGHLAAQKGDDKKAAGYYRQAIQIMESLPENATSYNNTALTYFSLHRVTGDQAAYGKGVDLMSKAVDLAPDQSILLSNSASALVTNSLYETLGDSVDYAFMKSTPTLETAKYHYANETQKAVIRDKLSAHPDMIKAIDYFERSILLSPNSLSNYSELQDVYHFLDDADGLAGLAAKMANNQVDISTGEQSYRDFLAGTDNDATLEKLKDQANTYEKMLNSRNLNAQTRAMLHGNLSENLNTQLFYGGANTAKSALSHAEKANELSTSSASKSHLTTALMAMAGTQAAEQFPAYKSLKDSTKKSVSDQLLLTLALDRNDQLGEWARKNALVKRAIDAEIGEFENFPLIASPSSWALLRHADDKTLADKMVERIKSNKSQQANRAIGRVASPYAASGIIDDHLLNKLGVTDGDVEGRRAKLSALGVTLPDELFQ